MRMLRGNVALRARQATPTPGRMEAPGPRSVRAAAVLGAHDERPAPIVARRAVLAAGLVLLQTAAAAAGPPRPAAASSSAAAAPPAGSTVAEAVAQMRSDLAQLSALRAELVETASCLAVDTPPECVGAGWPQLRNRLAAASAAAGRLRASAPVVGAFVAERRPGARGGPFGGAFGGRQVSPADLEYLEQARAAGGLGVGVGLGVAVG
jgi:hypothetical protein